MNDQAKAVAVVALLIICLLLICCVYLNFRWWDTARSLKSKREMANYYQDKYESLSRRHKYLKRGSARIARLYKINKERNR